MTTDRLTMEQQALAVANLGLAVALAKRFHWRWRRRLSISECTSAAMLGLTNAARCYRPDLGKFSTYAGRAIYNAIQIAAQHGGVISLPAKTESSDSPNHDEYASKRYRAHRVVSMNGISLVDHLPELTEEEEREQRQRAIWLRHHLAKLSIRHANVLRRIYFDDWTLDTISQDLGVSKNRVAQLRDAGLRQLKKLMRNEA